MPRTELLLSPLPLPRPSGAPCPSTAAGPVPGWWQPQFSSARVVALMTGRQGGRGLPPYDSFNLKPGIGDDEAAVRAHREGLQARIGWPLVRLDQVHGVAVHRVCAAAAHDPAGLRTQAVADASATDRSGLVCEIQVADCLPLLMADRQGRAVAAAHAGWRGLAGGVVEATLAQLCELSGAAAADVEVWLGPCIGPTAFEVGADVLTAFGVELDAAGAMGAGPALPRFRPLAVPARTVPKWLADLPGLARDRLQAAGVVALGGNDGSSSWCTHGGVERYFSYRRQAHTGRMSALIWLTA